MKPNENLTCTKMTAVGDCPNLRWINRVDMFKKVYKIQPTQNIYNLRSTLFGNAFAPAQKGRRQFGGIRALETMSSIGRPFFVDILMPRPLDWVIYPIADEIIILNTILNNQTLLFLPCCPQTAHI